jgi:hypothetical protein
MNSVDSRASDCFGTSSAHAAKARDRSTVPMTIAVPLGTTALVACALIAGLAIAADPVKLEARTIPDLHLAASRIDRDIVGTTGRSYKAATFRYEGEVWFTGTVAGFWRHNLPSAIGAASSSAATTRRHKRWRIRRNRR